MNSQPNELQTNKQDEHNKSQSTPEMSAIPLMNKVDSINEELTRLQVEQTHDITDNRFVNNSDNNLRNELASPAYIPVDPSFSLNQSLQPHDLTDVRYAPPLTESQSTGFPSSVHDNTANKPNYIEFDPIPNNLDSLTANVRDTFDKSKETPVMWKLLRTGNVSLMPFLSDCLNLVVASEVGGTLFEEYSKDQSTFHQIDPSLHIVALHSDRRYVNVDTTTEEGLQHARDVGLVESELADVVISPYLQQVTHTLFENTDKKARLFTVMRHPIEKVVSMFYFLKKTSLETGKHSWIQNMSIIDYVNSGYAESNFMVRSLVNKRTDVLLRSDVEAAKQILSQKFLLGLSDKLSESMDRIRLYFDWQIKDPSNVVEQKCKEQYLSEAHVDKHRLHHPLSVEGSEEWEVLKMKNWADVALYEYASEVLYNEQSSMFPSLRV